MRRAGPRPQSGVIAHVDGVRAVRARAEWTRNPREVKRGEFCRLRGLKVRYQVEEVLGLA